MNEMFDNIKVYSALVDSTGAPANTDSTGSYIFDMRGWDGLLLIGRVDAVTAGGLIQLRAYGGDSSGSLVALDTDYAAGTTSSTTDMDGGIILLDIVSPQHRWMAAYLDRATQVCRVDVIGVQYRGTNLPAAQSTTEGQFGLIAGQRFTAPTT